MKELLSTITSKGQVTIPKEVRDHLGLSMHDRIAFVVEDDGSVRLRVPRYPNVASLAGAAGSLGRQISWEELREAAREEHLENKISANPSNPSNPSNL